MSRRRAHRRRCDVECVGGVVKFDGDNDSDVGDGDGDDSDGDDGDDNGIIDCTADDDDTRTDGGGGGGGGDGGHVDDDDGRRCHPTAAAAANTVARRFGHRHHMAIRKIATSGTRPDGNRIGLSFDRRRSVPERYANENHRRRPRMSSEGLSPVERVRFSPSFSA